MKPLGMQVWRDHPSLP